MSSGDHDLPGPGRARTSDEASADGTLSDARFLIHGDPDETLSDPRFLIHADPDEVMALASRARGGEARLAAAVYRTSAGRHRDLPPAERRQILAVDAARWQAADLGRRLAEVPDEHGAAAPYRVEWATGTSLEGALLWSADLPDHDRLGPAGVWAMAAGGPPGRAVVTVAAFGRDGWTWDLASGSCVGRPVFGDGGVEALESVVLDGRRSLVVSGYSVVGDLVRASVWVMDAGSGQRVGSPFVTEGHVRDPLAVATVAGRPVAISAGSAVRAWDLLAQRPLGTPFEAHGGTSVISIATTTLDGRAVAVTGDYDGLVRVWDPIDGTEAAAPIETSGRPESLLALSLDGRPVVVAGGYDGPVEVRDLREGTLVHELLPEDVAARGGGSLAAAELDGRPIVVALDRDGRVRVLDLATGEPLCAPLPPGRGRPDAIRVAEAGGRPIAVTSGLHSSVVQAWDLAAACAAPAVGAPRSLSGDLTALAVGEVNGREVIVTAHHDGPADEPRWGEGYVCVTDLADGTAMAPAIPTGEGRTQLALADLHGDPVAVITCNERFVPRLLRLPEGQELDVTFTTSDHRQDHNGRITALATGRLGDRPVVVTGGRHNQARTWYLDSGAMRTAVSGRGDGYTHVTAAAVGSLRGRAVAVTAGHGSGTPEIRVWWLSSGRPVCQPEPGHSGAVNAVAISDLDGSPVAVTAGADQTVRVWDLDSGKLIRDPLIGHTAPVLAVAVTELDGRPAVVTGGADRTVLMWDLDSGRHLRRVDLPGAVSQVAVASGGRLVVAFDDDLAVMSPQHLMAER
ncbi:WD40 repeat domain-containing protein [Nonomuraea angiospora]|uniref:WD40 repeat protein n=1 Tax=Nonomuraea angiospora TaxID=46172 RepID=A0ABR9LX78_9ACTN|nr:WD40 repeat domain-containing protein [Nonomuraea angiospora]MBE1585261.1 WD40 repeat protein [Nonomuraea angiospora]